MSHKTDVDVIVFQYPGEVDRYCETYSLSNDTYKVVLSPFTTCRDRRSRNDLFLSSYLLTVKWRKESSKFMLFKVFDEICKKYVQKRKTGMCCKKLWNKMVLDLQSKPAICILEIYTCKTILKVKREESMKSHTDSKFIRKDFEQLSNDIKNIFDTSTFSDVTMTDGENIMHLHRLILSARSSVFKKMFQHPTKEMEEGLIKISDVSFDVLRVLVNYMYSGVVSIVDMEMARNLFIAADKFDIQKLKEICLAKLKQMSLDSVLDNLLLANFYGEKDLKDSAFAYISENSSKVKNLEKWKKFTAENDALAIEVLTYLLDKKVVK